MDTLSWTGPDLAWSDELMAAYARERIEATPEERRPEMRRYEGSDPPELGRQYSRTSNSGTL